MIEEDKSVKAKRLNDYHSSDLDIHNSRLASVVDPENSNRRAPSPKISFLRARKSDNNEGGGVTG